MRAGVEWILRRGGWRGVRLERCAARWALLSACVCAAIVYFETAAGASAASPISWSAPEQILPGLPPPSWEPPQNAPELDGVACPSAELCVAVDDKGEIVTSTDPTGAAVTWHAAHVGSTPLEGVACQSSTLCAAWGGHAIESSTAPASAGSWTPTTIAAGAKVDAVSCPEASLCLAITGSNSLVSSTDP